MQDYEADESTEMELKVIQCRIFVYEDVVGRGGEESEGKERQ